MSQKTSQMRPTVIVRDASGTVIAAWRKARLTLSYSYSSWPDKRLDWKIKTITTSNGDEVAVSPEWSITEITETDAEWEARGLAEGWQAQGDEGGV